MIAPAGLLLRAICALPAPGVRGALLYAVKSAGALLGLISRCKRFNSVAATSFMGVIMSAIQITWQGNGLRLLQQATQALGSEAKGRRAFGMALNKTVVTVNKHVKRSLSEQMGIPQYLVVKHGGMRIVRASSSNLNAIIDVRGAYLPLKDFKPVSGAKGVRAGAWGVRRLYPGTWVNRGKLAATRVGPSQGAKAGGHVFKNNGKFNKRSKRNNGIEALWGPAVPVEVVKDESAKTFYRIADTRMPIEIERAIVALTKGVISRGR